MIHILTPLLFCDSLSGGGASRMARQVGLGRALEIVLGARDFDADEAERVGTINRALDPDEIGPYVDALAKRIALWPSESINATKQCVIESIDVPIAQALKNEAYWLSQAVSQTPALARFKKADEDSAQFDMDNQRAWEDMLVKIQSIN